MRLDALFQVDFHRKQIQCLLREGARRQGPGPNGLFSLWVLCFGWFCEPHPCPLKPGASPPLAPQGSLSYGCPGPALEPEAGEGWAPPPPGPALRGRPAPRRAARSSHSGLWVPLDGCCWSIASLAPHPPPRRILTFPRPFSGPPVWPPRSGCLHLGKEKQPPLRSIFTNTSFDPFVVSAPTVVPCCTSLRHEARRGQVACLRSAKEGEKRLRKRELSLWSWARGVGRLRCLLWLVRGRWGVPRRRKRGPTLSQLSARFPLRRAIQGNLIWKTNPKSKPCISEQLSPG